MQKQEIAKHVSTVAVVFMMIMAKYGLDRMSRKAATEQQGAEPA